MQWLEAVKTYTRLVTAPDGTAHLITMPGWHWNSLDWMNSTSEWKEQDFVEMAWASAQEGEEKGVAPYANRTENFIWTLKAHIWKQATRYIYQARGAVND